jgi:hypothetical protein
MNIVGAIKCLAILFHSTMSLLERHAARASMIGITVASPLAASDEPPTRIVPRPINMRHSSPHLSGRGPIHRPTQWRSLRWSPRIVLRFGVAVAGAICPDQPLNKLGPGLCLCAKGAEQPT